LVGNPTLGSPKTDEPVAALPQNPLSSAPPGFLTSQPVVPPDLKQVYLPCVVDDRTALQQASRQVGGTLALKGVQLLYDVGLLGAASVRFVDQRRSISEEVDKLLLALGERQFTGLDWGRADTLPISPQELSASPSTPGTDGAPFFAELPAGLANAKALASAAKALSDWLYYNSQLPITVHAGLGLFRNPREDERSFKIRLQQAAREQRDAEVDKLRSKMAREIQRVGDRLAKEEQSLAQSQASAQARQAAQWIHIGESMLNFFTGRRSVGRAVSSATSKWNQAQQAGLRVEESKQTVARLEEEKHKLEEQLQAEIDILTTRWEQTAEALTTETIKPRRTDVSVRLTALAWAPVWRILYDDGSGEREVTLPAYVRPGP
jgi:hypothetical protein